MQVKLTLHSRLATAIYFLVAILITLPLLSFGQTIHTSGSLKYLRVANGYNGITLGSDVRQLTGSLSYMDGDGRIDADSCIKYACVDQAVLKMDTDMQLDMVGLRTYKNRIVNIYLFFNVKDAYKILAAFLRNYGQYTEKPIEYANIYNWNAGDVTLSLKYNPDIDKGVAIFSFNPLTNEIADMRRKQEQIERVTASVMAYANLPGNNKP